MRGLILAGGSGTRLWPLSCERCPKQFLSLGKKRSLLEQTVSRLSRYDLLVIANQKHRALVEKQVKTPTLIEPSARSTAPALALGLKYWIDRCGATLEDVCVVTPSDLYFESENDFIRLLPSAEEKARQGTIVTFGVLPTHPETGYGYIKKGVGKEIFPVEKFVEKPSRETAMDLIKEGNYYWNSGIFVFQIGHLLEEFAKHACEISSWIKTPYDSCMETFSLLPKISFDHAIMEKTDNIHMIPYPFGWSDLGTWQRLDAALAKDEKGNHFSGDVKAVESENCLVFGDDIAIFGVKDLVVVKQRGKVVVCSRKDLHRLSDLKIDSY